MKEIFKEIVEHYREDRKDFWESLIGMVLIMGFIVFTYWFVGTFCYDMWVVWISLTTKTSSEMVGFFVFREEDVGEQVMMGSLTAVYDTSQLNFSEVS